MSKHGAARLDVEALPEVLSGLGLELEEAGSSNEDEQAGSAAATADAEGWAVLGLDRDQGAEITLGEILCNAQRLGILGRECCEGLLRVPIVLPAAKEH